MTTTTDVTGPTAGATTGATTGPGLPRAGTPQEVGVDPAGVSAFLDDVAARGIELHSLMVVRGGRVAVEGWWAPYGPDRVHLLYSLSKSFTSTALGLAVDEGLVDLDATVLSYFPELDDEVTDPRSRAMRIRDVAAMASGHGAETLDVVREASPQDLVRGFLLLPPERDPGTLFTYNQPCTYALAAVVQRRAGTTLTEYLTPRLFAPLGITTGAWQQEPEGQDIGWSGLHLTTESVAAFGLLLLRDGVLHDGRRLLPEGWVAEASRAHVPTVAADPPAGAERRAGDWAQGYGFQYWRSRHGFRGDGAFGQFCLVLPEQDSVVVTTAGTQDMQGVLDAAWEHLLPALGGEVGTGGGDADAGAADALAARLADLALPVPEVVGDLAEAALVADPPGRLERVELRRAGERWVVEATVDGATWLAEAGVGSWAVTEPTDGRPALAVAVGAPADGTVVVEAALLETPHRLRLLGDRTTGRVTVAWHTAPLGRLELASMQRPLPTVGG
ncbi:serine hydrolase domain-containing protein [Cellulomonas marina]|uniref:CubicO group peptidase, beta-lactamase class C family n=1 Tax=Cellulomonas marina TaxID=988821 RepID=A0A1I0WUH0_9CELL|nr:serine hydrolase domain-containing protein [Cellulomonas marina]GIG30357.1 hypothetical protein Cma02nite_29570 [Cellulomonas marina]SFA92385.1 CubicO group peptidase, beta-lactamase class C family [Cellulomonas marina]